MVRQYGVKLPIRIFDTGSKGNSIYFTEQRLLVDLGLPKSDYPNNFFYDVDTIAITHHHGDHINPATICYVLEHFPHITIYMSKSCLEEITDPNYKAKYKHETDEHGNKMYEKELKNGSLVDNKRKPIYQIDKNGQRVIEKSPYKKRIEDHIENINTSRYSVKITPPSQKPYTLTFRQIKHGDILNRAIEIKDDYINLHALYVTDIDNLTEGGYFTDYKGRDYNLDGVSQKKDNYNLMLVEANYNEKKIKEYLDELNPNDPSYNNKRYRADQNLRHLSEEEASKYIKQALQEEGFFIPLHASEKFGTLFQK